MCILRENNFPNEPTTPSRWSSFLLKGPKISSGVRSLAGVRENGLEGASGGCPRNDGSYRSDFPRIAVDEESKDRIDGVLGEFLHRTAEGGSALIVAEVEAYFETLVPFL